MKEEKKLIDILKSKGPTKEELAINKAFKKGFMKNFPKQKNT